MNLLNGSLYQDNAPRAAGIAGALTYHFGPHADGTDKDGCGTGAPDAAFGTDPGDRGCGTGGAADGTDATDCDACAPDVAFGTDPGDRGCGTGGAADGTDAKGCGTGAADVAFGTDPGGKGCESDGCAPSRSAPARPPVPGWDPPVN